MQHQLMMPTRRLRASAADASGSDEVSRPKRHHRRIIVTESNGSSHAMELHFAGETLRVIPVVESSHSELLSVRIESLDSSVRRDIQSYADNIWSMGAECRVPGAAAPNARCPDFREALIHAAKEICAVLHMRRAEKERKERARIAMEDHARVVRADMADFFGFLQMHKGAHLEDYLTIFPEPVMPDEEAIDDD